MAKFHFKIRDREYSREADYEIPESKLVPPPHMIFEKRFEDPRELLKYRHSVINQHLQKWALAYTNPTWREIPDENQPNNVPDASRIDRSNSGT